MSSLCSVGTSRTLTTLPGPNYSRVNFCLCEPVFFFPSAHHPPFSFSATNPNRLQKAQNIASDLLGIKGEADKRDIARYQKTSAFSTSAQAPKDDVSPPSLLSSLKICESDSWKHILILRPLSSIGARQLRGSRGSRKWWGRLKILR